MSSLFKRVKHGEQPGDISRRRKIQLREGKVPFMVSPWQGFDERDARAFKRYMKEKGRKVQRRRDKKDSEPELT